MITILTLVLLLSVPGLANAAELPIFDTHVHYSHDAWSASLLVLVVGLSRA